MLWSKRSSPPCWNGCDQVLPRTQTREEITSAIRFHLHSQNWFMSLGKLITSVTWVIPHLKGALGKLEIGCWRTEKSRRSWVCLGDGRRNGSNHFWGEPLYKLHLCGSLNSTRVKREVRRSQNNLCSGQLHAAQVTETVLIDRSDTCTCRRDFEKPAAKACCKSTERVNLHQRQPKRLQPEWPFISRGCLRVCFSC